MWYRAGLDSEDEVIISSINSVKWTNKSNKGKTEEHQFRDPSNLIIFTTTDDDRIIADYSTGFQSFKRMFINSGEGADLVDGDGDDRIFAGTDKNLAGANIIVAGGGNDTIHGGESQDVVLGDMYNLPLADLELMLPRIYQRDVAGDSAIISQQIRRRPSNRRAGRVLSFT